MCAPCIATDFGLITRRSGYSGNDVLAVPFCLHFLGERHSKLKGEEATFIVLPHVAFCVFVVRASDGWRISNTIPSMRHAMCFELYIHGMGYPFARPPAVQLISCY